jgi:hypothetical protein
MNTIAGWHQSGEGVRRDTSPSALRPLVSIVKERPASVLRDGFAAQQRSACHA